MTSKIFNKQFQSRTLVHEGNEKLRNSLPYSQQAINKFNTNLYQHHQLNSAFSSKIKQGSHALGRADQQ